MFDAVFTFILILFVSMAGFIVWREYEHQKERKDLYTRIMAGSLRDYSLNEKKTPLGGGNFVRAGLKKHQNSSMRIDE